MKYCHPKLASAGVIAAFLVVTLVGANTHLGKKSSLPLTSHFPSTQIEYDASFSVLLTNISFPLGP